MNRRQRGPRALDRLPHWFAEGVISRAARPETVASGLAFLRANRPHLVPLPRLFALARVDGPTWCELADGRLPTLPAARSPRAAPPPALLAAESTVFGEFLVDRHGQTVLAALAEALIDGVPTGTALAALVGGSAEQPALEARWRRWLARTQ